jgi:acyl carrier protein
VQRRCSQVAATSGAADPVAVFQAPQCQAPQLRAPQLQVSRVYMQSQLTGSTLAQGSSNPSTDQENPALPVQPELEQEVAAMIVAALNLEMAPADIDPQAPLFGEGLGLDSIDILEVALVVSKKYGFQLRSDDSNNTRIFQSLRSLCQHIALNRLT